MTGQGRYPEELRERAVRMVFEHQDEHPSQWSAITSIAAELGVSREALRTWVRRAESGGGIALGPHQPRLTRRRLPEGAGGRPEPVARPDSVARTEGSTPRDPDHVGDRTTSATGPSGRETRFVSWADLERVADQAADVDAIVRRELEGIGASEHRLGEDPPRKPARRRRRLPGLLVAAVAASSLAVLASRQLSARGPERAAGSPTSQAAPVVPTTPPPPTRSRPPADQVIRARLTVSAPCWVQAVADGHTAFVGTVTGGTRTIRADRTLLLTLGNAGGVRLVVNGRSVETGSPGEVVHLSFALRQGAVIEA